MSNFNEDNPALGQNHFGNPLDEMQREVAADSPFGTSSMFHATLEHGYLTDNIDFVELTELIKRDLDADYTYKRFIGFRTVSYPVSVTGGEDGKFDRARGYVIQKTKTMKSTIPIKDGSRVLSLMGRLNKKDGVISLALGKSRDEKGGLEFQLDIGNRKATYYLHIYYKGKERVYLAYDDGTNIAISISTDSYLDFDLLEEHVGKTFLTPRFKAEIMMRFLEAFDKAGNHYKKLSWLYEIVPPFVLEERDDELLYRDFSLILAGMSARFPNAYGTNQNVSLLNILAGIAPGVLYQKFKENQSVLFTILGKLDADFDLPFISLLVQLCYEGWTEADMQSAESIIVGESDDNTRYYITRIKPRIDLFGRIAPKGKVNFQNIGQKGPGMGFQGTKSLKSYHLAPLTPLYVRSTTGDSVLIPAFALQLFLEKAESRAKVEFYTEILLVVATAGSVKVLQTAGLPLFLRVLAAIEVAKAPIDAAIRMRGVKAALMRTEEGKWFLAHWPGISTALDITTLGADALYGLVRNGPKVVDILRRKRRSEAADKLEEVLRNARKRLEELGGDATKSFFANAKMAFSQIKPLGALHGQSTDYTCVATSLRMYLADIGKDLSEGYIAKAVKTIEEGPSRGASILDIPEALYNLRMDNVIARAEADISLANFTKQFADGDKAIVSVRYADKHDEGKIFAHAMLLDKIEDGKVFLRDPLPMDVGASYSVKIEDFEKVFNEKAIIIKHQK